VAATLDTQDITRKVEKAKVGQSMVKPTPCQTNRFSVLEASTVGSTKNMFNPTVTCRTNLELRKLCLKKTHLSLQTNPFFICSTTLRRGTEVPLKLNTIDSDTPMSVKALIDSGTTRQLIDIEYTW